MGASKSKTSTPTPNPSPPQRRQLVSRNPSDQLQARHVHVGVERREIQLGNQRVEADKVQIISTSSSGDRLCLEKVQIRVQSSGNVAGTAISDGRCTYDSHGPGYMLQPWYKCCTCWGEDAVESQFGCCSHCAAICHNGHRLVRCEGLANGECDCGQNKHQTAVCSWHVTQRNYIKQPFYRCFDCFNQLNEGVCYQCWKTCHRGHTTQYAGIMPAFCDCGLDCCRIKCSIARPQ